MNMILTLICVALFVGLNYLSYGIVINGHFMMFAQYCLTFYILTYMLGQLLYALMAPTRKRQQNSFIQALVTNDKETARWVLFTNHLGPSDELKYLELYIQRFKGE